MGIVTRIYQCHNFFKIDEGIPEKGGGRDFFVLTGEKKAKEDTARKEIPVSSANSP
jgi:hypothetical protein